MIVRNFHDVLDNSRFWILASGLVASLIILGLVQENIPPGSLQVIRLEQTYGFISLGLIYLALLASPLTSVFSGFPYKAGYLHARRALGVLGFYYAFLHAYGAFFLQLQGFKGIGFLSPVYVQSLLYATVALAILTAMALTSTDWAIKLLSFRRWKWLQRLVYIAVALIMVHVVLIGTHFIVSGLWSTLVYLAVAYLIVLEAIRLLGSLAKRSSN